MNWGAHSMHALLCAGHRCCSLLWPGLLMDPPHPEDAQQHVLPPPGLVGPTGHGMKAIPSVGPCADAVRVRCCAAQALLQDDEAQLTAGLLAHAGDGAAAAAPTLSPRMRSSIEGGLLVMGHSPIWEVLQEVVLPVAILLLGVGFSIAALWVSVAAL